AGAPTMRPNFGAEWAGSGHTLSTLRPGRRPPGRKPRFRLLAKLYRVGSLAHWVPPKGFFDASYIAFLLSQAFPGASARRSATLLGASRFRQSAEVTSTSGSCIGVSHWSALDGSGDTDASISPGRPPRCAGDCRASGG